MSFASRRKSNASSSFGSTVASVVDVVGEDGGGGGGTVVDTSTSKHTSCLSSLSHRFSPTMTLHESRSIEKRSGARRDPFLARSERTRTASAYVSARGLTTSSATRCISGNASKHVAKTWSTSRSMQRKKEGWQL